MSMLLNTELFRINVLPFLWGSQEIGKYYYK